jgi:hypothetical protein
MNETIEQFIVFDGLKPSNEEQSMNIVVSL